MKRCKLKFKVAALTSERAEKLLTALGKLGLEFWDGISYNTPFILVSDNFVSYTEQHVAFVGSDEPEVTYQQALDLIAQVEPELKKEGEFVEFEVSANGMFIAEWQSDRPKAYWSNVVAVECLSSLGLVFAGWVWDAIKSGGQPVSTLRMGFGSDGYLTSGACHWTKPAQPIAVRFWRKNK